MALKGRFGVEVRTRFTPAGWSAPDLPPAAPLPRLTETAAAFGLTGAALDAELVSVRAKRSELAAYEAGLVERKATLGAQHVLPLLPGARTDIGGGADPAARQAADDFLPDEVAVLLRCSVTSARYLVEHALVLVRQLPVVWHALADGRVDEARAKVICEALRWQSAGVGGPFADEDIAGLAARAVGWAERGCPPTTLRERLQAGLLALDPQAADRRREQRVRAGDVTTTPTGDGTSQLRATGVTTERAALIRAQLTAYAKKLKADGDPRPLGALRNAVLDALITRPWDSPDPAVAHVTITADLHDLIDPDQVAALRDLITAVDPAAQDQDETAVGSTGDDQLSAGTSIQGPSVQDTSLRDTSARDSSVQDTSARDTSARDSSVQDRSVRDRSARDRSAQDRSALDRSVRDTCARGTAARGGTTRGGSGKEDAVLDGRPGDECADRARDAAAVTGGAGDVGGQPVTPAAVRELLRLVDALGLVDPAAGDLAISLIDRGRLLAVASPAELLAAARNGTGLAPPPPTSRYTPTAAQYRYLRARDRHCRFPGCRRTARDCDADHVIPYDHRDPAAGGATCIRNLALLCRHHHRLKTHAPGWAFRMDPDGTLHVTTPGSTTLATRPPGIDRVLDPGRPPPPPHDPVADPAPF